MTRPDEPEDAVPQDARPSEPPHPGESRRSEPERKRHGCLIGCLSTFVVFGALFVYVCHLIGNGDAYTPPPGYRAPPSPDSTAAFIWNSPVPGSGSGSSAPPQYVAQVTVPLDDTLTITVNEPDPYYNWAVDPEDTPGSASPEYEEPGPSFAPTPCPGDPSWSCDAEAQSSTYFLQNQGDYTVEWQGEMWLPYSASQSAFVPIGQPCPAHLTVPPPAQQDGCTVATLLVHVTVTGTPSPSASLAFTGGAR